MRADANVYVVIRQDNNEIVWIDASLKHMLEQIGDTGNLKPRNEILPFLRVGIAQEFSVNGHDFVLTTHKLGTGVTIAKSIESNTQDAQESA